jgi:predicted nucleic acid-binding protein
MRTVIDTSTLISLARIHCLDLITALKIDVILPNEVYEEAVIIGEEKEIADAFIIKSFLMNNHIKIESVDNNNKQYLRQKLNKILSKGDEAILALAVKRKANQIITNDDGLGKIASALGFRVNATPDLLLQGLIANLFDIEKFEIYIRGLVLENRVSSVVAELYIMEGKKYVKS